MRKTAIGFLLAAVYAMSAHAADVGAMSARILAATGGNNTSNTTATTRSDDNNANTNQSVRGTTTRTRTAGNVVRSGNRVVNLDTPVVATRSADTTTTAARATRNRASKNSPKSAAEKLESAVNNVGQSERTSAASINAKPAIRRAGLTLRPSVADVGGRAKIAGTDMYTGSNLDNEIRGVTARATSTAVTAESITDAKDRLEKTAELNKSCQDQYNECMDQFCAVIDANQKRCTCSANLQNYAKVEEAVKDANVQLNEVAQRIRYIGLSADEITAIMSATEAEEVLSSTTDTTENRSLLDDIAELIQDPTRNVSYGGGNLGDLDLNLDLDFSSDTTDIFSLDFLSGGTTESFSNMRGTQLYNAAKKRCATILKQCVGAGATENQITGNYDLAIDKDCIAYENGLKKMNETLKSNVRSANNMLQKARLMVLQNKNQYDARGCIGALETCMMDDMVCGKEYTKCLDPTKFYINENGEVILGQDIGKILDFMKTYDNTKIDAKWINDASSATLDKGTCADDTNSDGRCVAKYLMSKIGTGQKVTDGGLCRAVLDKCQNYTYNDGNYDAYNDIVVNYIERALVNINAAQSEIIADYAASCLKDMASCYNQQMAQLNSWSAAANTDSIVKIMASTCRNVALTCGYAVFHYEDNGCGGGDENKCINDISNVFYQSLLCPENSTYYSVRPLTKEANCAKMGAVNTQCLCNAGYMVLNNQCVAITDTSCTNPTQSTQSEDAWAAMTNTKTKQAMLDVCKKLASLTGHDGDSGCPLANTDDYLLIDEMTNAGGCENNPSGDDPYANLPTLPLTSSSTTLPVYSKNCVANSGLRLG